MRFGVLVALLVTAFAVVRCGGGLFRQPEYEEDVYLSLDGTATVYVNASIAALDALRGATFDTNPNRPVDRDAVRRYFTTPGARVTPRVSTSRRSNRRFVHVRLEVEDISRLGESKPFAWSAYRFDRIGNGFEYRQTVGSAAATDRASPDWTGAELVAFRLHLPSKIDGHEPGGTLQRGNILVWEQPLADRLRGVPVVLEARMQTRSILSRTLWLFGATFGGVAFAFLVVIWWVLRRGAEAAQT